MKKTTFLLLTLLAAHPAQAAVLVTYAEDPGAVNSTLDGTQVFDFNNLSKGLNRDVVWEGVGTFDQIFVKSTDIYGGAVDPLNPNGSLYSVQGAGTSVSTTTIKLDTPSSYFGMWWSAGDASNLLSFYNEDVLVAQFTTSSLLGPLPAEYYGNPKNDTLNVREPYAFINFIADLETSWDTIVLTNAQRSGFESDNYTSRVAAWDPLVDGELPGNPVAIIDGANEVTVTDTDLTGSTFDSSAVASVPGAPAPPAVLLLAFGATFLLRSHFGRRSA